MTANQIIALANFHLDQAMYSAARFNLAEAERFNRQGHIALAKKKAALSLAHSVGLSHPDYILVSSDQDYKNFMLTDG